MKKFLYEYGQLNWLYALFAANVVGFLVAFFAFMFSNGESVLFFAIHSGDKYSLFKIWKLITYAFFDHTIFSLISNLIWLAIFAMPLSTTIGSTKHIRNIYLLTTIVIGLISGLLCFFETEKYPIFLLGFSMVTISVASACVYKIPNYQINLMLIGSIPIWIIGLIFLLFSIFTFPSKEMALMLLISFLAAVLGVLYMINLEKGNLPIAWKGMISFPIKKKKRKGKLVAISGNNNKKIVDHLNQEKLNTILDKISEKGLNNISDDEKKFLENFNKG